MQKVAERSGPNTVAMVYLSGYGVQLAGENYFIPVNSTINRDTDIPIEGLRVSDYTRELASHSVESQHLRARCRTAAALHRRRKPDCKRASAGRSRAELADRVQCRSGHGRAQRGRALRRLRAGARGNDPHRRPAAVRRFRSRALARQRKYQGRDRSRGMPRRSRCSSPSSIARPMRHRYRAPPIRSPRSASSPIRDLGAQEAFTAALDTRHPAGL